MNFQPYKSNGLEISVKKKLDPFKMQLSMLLLNELSKKINLTKLSLCYNQKPHKLSLKYLASKNPFPVFELDYFGTVKIEPFKNIDFGFSCNFNERHSYNLNYYELFLKGSIQSYQILGALTSNKGGIGQKKLSPGILTLAFKKDYRGKVLNMVLEHHLQEKTSLLSACYESNIEEAIILKNMVFLLKIMIYYFIILRWIQTIRFHHL